MSRPLSNEYGVFYKGYVDHVPEESLEDAMANAWQELADALASLPASRADHAYAPGKWTVKQLLQHIIDTERVFSYRAVAIARGESQALPGFDENSYAEHAHVNDRDFDSMKEEMLALRRSVLLMYSGFTEEMLSRSGVASNNSISVRALGYITVGHVRHHLRILRERYL